MTFADVGPQYSSPAMQAEPRVYGYIDDLSDAAISGWMT